MGQVLSSVASNYADGSAPAQALVGKQGEALSADIHGQHYAAAVRGKVFKATSASITMPTIAASLASLFSLYNPPGSGVIADVLHTEFGHSTATDVVDIVGWYTSTLALTALGTVGTAFVAGTNLFSARVGDVAAPSCIAGAFTHSGTPVRVEMVCTIGAVTDSIILPAIVKNHNGTLLLPPGYVISLATSTAAFAAVAAGVTWAEWPYSASA